MRALVTSSFNFILLAAGKSERMLTDKALLDFHGMPWVLKQIDEIKKCPFVKKVLVVANPLNLPLIEPLLAGQAIVIENALPAADPFSSILLGLKFLGSSDGVFVSPIDVPLSALVIEQLSRAAKLSSVTAVVPEFAKKSGHPVLLLEKAQADLESESRLDYYLRKIPSQDLLRVVVEDPQIHWNLNTPQAWNEFIKI